LEVMGTWVHVICIHASCIRHSIPHITARTIFCTAAVQPEPVKRTTSSAALPVTRAFTDSVSRGFVVGVGVGLGCVVDG
jgi:hypothetical protein